MDSRQGEDDDDEGTRRRRREATEARTAGVRDGDASESGGDGPRLLSRKRKGRSASSEEEEEEVVTLKGKPSALRKLLEGGARSEKKRVRREITVPAARAERVGERVDERENERVNVRDNERVNDEKANERVDDERANERVDDERANERVDDERAEDERVGTQVPASSTIGELPDEELTAKELATLQQLMSLAGGIPRLDVLRALRVVDFNVVKAVMLLELVRVRETNTLQDVVMDALITDALSEKEQAELEKVMSLSECAERVDAFRAYCVSGGNKTASYLDLVYQQALAEDETEDSYYLEDYDEASQAEIKQVMSLAGNVSHSQAIVAWYLCDWDVNKAAMLLALIISQDPALRAPDTVQ